MNKWIFTLAATALMGSGFAAQEGHEVAFARSRSNDNEQGKDRAKFFFGYKLFLTQPGSTSSQDNYAQVTDANNSTAFLNANFDWDYGHFGVLGVQLPKTLFKVFLEGWFFHNKKNKANDTSSAASVGRGFAFDVGALNPTYTDTVTGNAKDDLYFVNLFVSYAAYRKGNFFFIPYAGPRYAQNQNNLQGIFADANNSETYTLKTKKEGFGIVMAFMLKYFFTSKFYAYGDYRYSIVFARGTQNQNYASTNAQLSPESRVIVGFSSEEIQELAFGCGVLAVEKENWNLAIDACYKLIRWQDANQNYQGLGLGLQLGF